MTTLSVQPAIELHPRRCTRPRRMLFLLAGILVLSVMDLVVTVTYLHTTGMNEVNPLAELILAHTGSVWALAGFKAFTVGLSVSILYRLRHLWISEAAAWTGLAILATLAIYWGYYAEQTSTALGISSLDNGSTLDHWISLAE